MGKSSTGRGASKKGQKRPTPEVTDAAADPLLTDPRFNSASWDPRFSRVPKRAKRAIADDRFKSKLKENPGFREKHTPVDRFGRPKTGPKLHQSISQLAASDTDKSSDDDGSDSESDGIAPAHARDVSAESESDDSDSDESNYAEFVQQEDEVPEPIPRGNATKRLAVIGLDWSVTRAVDIFASLGCFCPTGKRIEFVEVHPSKFGLERLAIEAKLGPQVVAQEDIDVVENAQANGDIPAPQEHTDLLSDDDEEDEVGEASSSDESDNPDPSDEAKWKEQANLRRYEEERLKYFYGVVQFEDVKTADAVYEQCDGVDYAQSGRAFDLRFIPDEMVIETKPRDRAARLPDGYAPPTVNLSSLNNSTVKLSWDADDPDRVILKKKAFGRHQMDEENLKAYLASSSDEEEDGKPTESEINEKRNLLLGATEGAEGSEDSDGDVDLEVTFEPGMLEKGEEIIKRKLEKEQQAEETEWEARLRRIRERKNEKRKQRRERLAAKDRGEDSDASGDNDEDADVEIDTNPSFSDPFFTTGQSLEAAEEAEEAEYAAQMKKKRRHNKRHTHDSAEEGSEMQEDAEKLRQQAELELLTMDDGKARGGGGNSSMQAMRARLADADSDEEGEHRGRKNGKRTRGKRRAQKEARKQAATEKQVSTVDVADPRFQNVFQSHLFAIDPTHPKFRENDTTKRIISEKGRRVSKRDMGAVDGPSPSGEQAGGGSGSGAGSGGSNAQNELRQLAARAKARRKQKEKEASLKAKRMKKAKAE